MTESEIYEQGFRDGEQRGAERLERAWLQVRMLEARYNYLLNLMVRVDELMLQPTRFIITKPETKEA